MSDLISPYNPYPDVQRSLVGRAFGAGLRTGGPTEHFVGNFHLRDGFGVYDDDPTFNPIDAPECIASGSVAAIGSLEGFIDRED
jgi:hypothetical protein